MVSELRYKGANIKVYLRGLKVYITKLKVNFTLTKAGIEQFTNH